MRLFASSSLLLVSLFASLSALAEPISFVEAQKQFHIAIQKKESKKSAYQRFLAEATSPVRMLIDAKKMEASRCGTYECAKSFEKEIDELRKDLSLQRCAAGFPDPATCEKAEALKRDLAESDFRLPLIAKDLLRQAFAYEALLVLQAWAQSNEGVNHFQLEPLDTCVLRSKRLGIDDFSTVDLWSAYQDRPDLYVPTCDRFLFSFRTGNYFFKGQLVSSVIWFGDEALTILQDGTREQLVANLSKDLEKWGRFLQKSARRSDDRYWRESVAQRGRCLDWDYPWRCREVGYLFSLIDQVQVATP